MALRKLTFEAVGVGVVRNNLILLNTIDESPYIYGSFKELIDDLSRFFNPGEEYCFIELFINQRSKASLAKEFKISIKLVSYIYFMLLIKIDTYFDRKVKRPKITPKNEKHLFRAYKFMHELKIPS